ncbi:unnamed protein product [Medioppia subpectinata]|uniref:Protein kinase domain-containing protein n=1 Tax=Medioppia subpectinata TaxID=1979941 RepID=A0A7R9KAV5_9ACAR|nr:unnamed protein product [Medioppia subpectinata]CAG2100074.1 unnamed protein product [Medioppia subpectinata]
MYAPTDETNDPFNIDNLSRSDHVKSSVTFYTSPSLKTQSFDRLRKIIVQPPGADNPSHSQDYKMQVSFEDKRVSKPMAFKDRFGSFIAKVGNLFQSDSSSVKMSDKGMRNTPPQKYQKQKIETKQRNDECDDRVSKHIDQNRLVVSRESKALDKVSNKNFFVDNFETENNIGIGKFGGVYKVKHRFEKKIYAVKVITFFVKLRSDYVVNYRNFWVESNNFYIQMDYYSRSLQTILDTKHIVFGREPEDPMDCIEELLESVRYLHEMCPPVIHGNLKPANVLISLNNNNNHFIKLSDLGSATFHDMPFFSHTSNVKTAQYMAPEIQQRQYNSKVDIYSLGVIAFHLFDLFNIRPIL